MSPYSRHSEIHQATQSDLREGITFSRQIRFWAWINIIPQFFLPLMLAFTPAVRAAQAKWYETPPQQQTVSVSTDELPSLGSPDNDEKRSGGNEAEARTAQMATQTGRFLNDASSDAAAGMARQMATGKASAEIEQWLNRVGTARVQMQVDKEFSLKGSSVDLLIPWYERPDALIFSQHSLHRTDDRTQGNLGAGYRYYAPDWMAGVNAFYDYDFSGEHSRMGVGLEYSRDYLKLAANGYFRLSGWKTASDLSDYEARPANGWDIRSEGYLPVYPQLGGKLVYEQYYGKEVGLFGRDNRQQDPRALTAGLNYTPFPLMKFSADHRLGEGGEHDTRLGVDFTWQFDTPFSKLLDTDAVGQMRTLAGSRYNLVDRNNNIVLEYRAKNTLTLKMADALRGHQGDRLSLDVVVNTRHGLERIEWDDSALRAAGGELACTAHTQCMVTLPLWKSGGIEANTYVINAVAHDKAGNQSPQASTHIFVEQSVVHAEHSTFDIVPTADASARSVIIEADGVSTATMTFRAFDENNLPVTSLSTEMQQHESSLSGMQISSVREVSAGVYVATVSGNVAGEAWMAPVVDGSVLSSLRKPVAFVSSAAVVSDFSVVTDNAAADGVAANSVKATVIDAQGNPLADREVSFSADNGAVIATSGITGPDGSVTIPLTSTRAGVVTVTAVVDGSTQSVSVTFIADARTAQIAGDLVVVADNAVANGTATNSVKATVTDAQGNALAGQSVSFSADNGATIAASGVTGEDGSVTLMLTSTTAGQSVVNASINGGSQSVRVTFVADTGTAQITATDLVVVNDYAVADGSATNSVKAIVTDAQGNPLAGQTVSFSAGNGATIAATGETGDDGSVSVTLTSTMAGVSAVTASISGSSQSVNVTFVADSSTAQIIDGALSVVADNAPANGVVTNRVKATVTDHHGNLLANQSVTFTVDNGARFVAGGTDTVTLTTDEQGDVTVALISHVAGVAGVTASLGNGNQRNVNVTFTADTGTAQLAEGALTVETDNALANGTATNSVKATVTDAQGNALANQSVSFSADNGATIAASGVTGADGSVIVTLTNTTAGISAVTATISGSSQSVNVTFTADSGTAQLAEGSLTVETDNALANGTATNSVKAVVTDAQGNALAGQSVSFSADNGVTIAASGVTGEDGSVTVTLTSLTAGVSGVTASINGSSQSVSVTFTADESTAQLAEGALTVETDNALANGTATNSVKAVVTDAQGNALAGQSVNFSAGNGATIAASGVTGADGSVVMTLTNTTAGISAVTATISGSSQSVSVTFTADSGTAQLAEGSLTVETDNALANGTATNSVKATVTDAQGNALAGQTVSFSAGNGATIAASGVTGEDGSVTVTLTSLMAGVSAVTATISGSSQSVNVTFTADSGTAQLAEGALTVETDNALANGSATNSVKAVVTDAQGNALAGQTVSFSADNGATIAASGVTGEDGSVVMTLTNTTAGISAVTATISGSSQSVNVTFTADSGTAQLAEGSLTVETDNALANGTATNSVKALVTDAQGNALAGQSVSFSADNGATIAASGVTGEDGSVTVTLTSLTAGASVVTASINGSSQSVSVTFVADIGTAQLAEGALTVETDNALANGTATNSVKALVTDAQGNALANQTVSFSADNGATIAASGVTGADGSVTVTLTSLMAGVSAVTATISGSSQSVNVTFTADSGTAQLAEGSLTVETDNALANGTATNSVKALVTDAQGNALANQTVSFSADNGATIAASGVTGEDGSVTVTLTSLTAGASVVTASINGSSQSVSVTFVADIGTAQLAEGALTVETDNALANGSATNSVKAVVTDAQGNALANQSVSFSADNGATIAASGVTGEDGSVVMTLTNTTAGISAVTATVNGSSRSVSVTFTADTGTAQIIDGALSVVADNAPANGVVTNRVKATVTDHHGNLLANQSVTFTVDNGARFVAGGTDTVILTTDEQGDVTVALISHVAGVAGVTASLDNGSSRSVNVSFVADVDTAQIVDGALTVVDDGRAADGVALNKVQVVVTDAQGNRVSGQTVSFSVTNGAVLTAETAVTGDDGVATMTLSNTTAGVTAVTASLSNDSSRSVNVSFIADERTAQLAVSSETASVAADGTTTRKVTAVLMDAQDNPLSGQSVSFSVDDGPLFAGDTTTFTGNTSAEGVLEVTLTSTVAGTFSVTATVSTLSLSDSATVSFIADERTAQIVDGALTVVDDGRAADGVALNKVQVVVTDARGNPLSGQTVSFSVTNGAVLTAETAVTGDDGVATMTLSNTTAGVTAVTASLDNGSSRSVNVSFIADERTAQLAVSSETASVAADGTTTRKVTAVLTDARGNALENQSVSFSVDDGPLFAGDTTTFTGNTSAEGVLEVTLTSTVAGTFSVTAAVSTLSLSDSATVSFIADERTAQLAVSSETASVAADGTTTRKVTVVLTDAQDNPLSGQSVSFSVDDGPLFAGDTTTFTGNTSAEGVLEVTLTSTVAGTFSVTAAVSTLSLSDSAAVSFIADERTAQIVDGALTVVDDGRAADGVALNKVQVVVTDARGNPLSGQTVSFSVTNGAVLTAETAVTGEDGVAIMTLSNTTAGVTAVTASLSNDSSSSVNVTFVAEFQLELEVIEDDALPDGSHVNKVKATVKNASDEFVQGAQVNFTSAEGVTITVPGTTDENGSVTATFTSYEPGTFSVRAVVGNDISETTNIHFVTVTGTLTLSPGSVVADGVSQVIITVDLKDENDQAVEGWSAQRPIRVLSSEELTSLDSDQNQLTEVGGGIYKITVIAGLVPGTDTFRIVSGLPNGTIVNNSAELTLTPLTPATGTISWSSDGIVRSVERTADGTTELTVTVKLKDSEGRPVRGWNPVSITSKLGLTRSISAGGEMTLSELAGTPGTYQGKVIVGTTAGTESIWVEQQVSFGNLRPMEAENGQQKGISLKQTAGELHSGTIELSSSSVPADGSSVVTLTVKLRDVYGNLVSNNGDVYVGSRRGLTNVPMGSGNYLILTEVSEGVYTTQIQAGTTAGDDDFWVVQASSFPDHIPGPMTGDNLVTLTLTPGELHSGTIELSSSSITANGTETTQLTVKLKDINGNLTDNEGTVYVQSSNGRTRVAASPGYTALTRTSLGTYTATLSGTVAGNERIWVEQLASFGALRPMPTNQGVDLTLTPGELHSGSIELSSSSITANGTETTQLTVKLKDINGNLTDNEGTVYVQSSNGRTRVAASPGYTALTRTSLGTYTATLSGTVAGNERIWVEQLASFGALRPMPVGQGVNLTLTAGPASSAWISLSEKTNGESLANSKSLVANGSNSTMIVVTVKDVKGNGVTGLESVLKVRAGAGALMKTGTGTAIARNTDYSGFEASTTAGVYYLKVVAGTTAGTETFWVSGGLEQGIVINNSVTITLTSPPPVSAKMNAWWSYNGGSNGSNYRTFSSAVRFLDSSNNAIQCDTVTVVGASGTGYAANANTTMANRHTFEGYNWSNNSSTFNAGTKVYSFTKDVSIGKNGGAGYVYSVVLAASGETTSPVIGHGSLGFDGMLTFTCTVGGTAYIFKSGDGKTAVDNTLGL